MRHLPWRWRPITKQSSRGHTLRKRPGRALRGTGKESLGVKNREIRGEKRERQKKKIRNANKFFQNIQHRQDLLSSHDLSPNVDLHGHVWVKQQIHMFRKGLLRGEYHRIQSPAILTYPGLQSPRSRQQGGAPPPSVSSAQVSFSANPPPQSVQRGCQTLSVCHLSSLFPKIYMSRLVPVRTKANTEVKESKITRATWRETRLMSALLCQGSDP